MQSALNYEEMVSGRPAVVPLGQRGCVEHILLTERDAVLCQSLAHAAAAQRPGAQFLRRPLVVGAVGEAHIEGIAELWVGRKWQDVLQEVAVGERFSLLLSFHGYRLYLCCREGLTIQAETWQTDAGVQE